MMFANDIILVDETRERIRVKLEKLRESLKCKGFKISRMKREYMECNLNKNGEKK